MMMKAVIINEKRLTVVEKEKFMIKVRDYVAINLPNVHNLFALALSLATLFYQRKITVCK